MSSSLCASAPSWTITPRERGITSEPVPPDVIDQRTWEEKSLAAHHAEEKELTRRLDALAAARRRLLMVRLPEYTLRGDRGETTLVDIFEGRRQLVTYRYTWAPLDLTVLGHQECWQDTPHGGPQTARPASGGPNRPATSGSSGARRRSGPAADRIATASTRDPDRRSTPLRPPRTRDRDDRIPLIQWRRRPAHVRRAGSAQNVVREQRGEGRPG